MDTWHLAAIVVIILLIARMHATRNTFRCGACPPGSGAPGSGAVCFWKKTDLTAKCAQCVEGGDCPAGGPTACVNNQCVCRDDGDCPGDAPRCCGGSCRRGCCNNGDCPPYSVCSDGKCTPALPCADSSDCPRRGECGGSGICIEPSGRTCFDSDAECGPRGSCEAGQCDYPVGPLDYHNDSPPG